jgi:GMP synthase (glutamine-hydrolysing)
MQKIIILDFGSQVTQLIARSIRELNVYCEILPYHTQIINDGNIKGIILSGSPASVNQENAPIADVAQLIKIAPILGICYGAQLTAKIFGGSVQNSNTREYGRAELTIKDAACAIFKNINLHTNIWMSHGDTIQTLPNNFEIIASTPTVPIAAYGVKNLEHPLFALQFHPEVTHSEQGKVMIKNFVMDVCTCDANWTPKNYAQESVATIKKQIGDSKVIMALSGGVDSTVAATLIHRAVGDQLFCIFVDNGLLRKDEFETVLEDYKSLGLNVKGVQAADRFYSKLAGKSDPEVKRKIIGGLFIEIFDEEARLFSNAAFLGQGTIYPDVIESVSLNGPSATIKSHHNVGGLPEKMNMQLVEPLRLLFKDEVRKLGAELGIASNFLQRHPFPGPGLGIRVLGEVTAEKAKMLKEADAIFINELKSSGLYDQVWQAGAILLPVQSVGVMGDERTYEFTIALRAVTSVDGMTADWAHLPYDFLGKVSNEIINHVRGINRVVYDISSKPPATIEWE